MTLYGAESQHEEVGVNVFYDTITAGTTSSNVYTDWYARSVNWGFNDGQTLTVSGSVTGTFNFTFNVGSGIADQYVGRLIRYAQPVLYGGGPTLSVTGKISGQYLGGAPSVTYTWSMAGRPASVPAAPGTTTSAVTSNSATVTLTAGASNGATIDSYETQLSTSSSFSTIFATKTGGANTFTGLATATTYYTRARAHNSVGWSAYASTDTFVTGSTVPGQVTGVSSSAVDQSTATVTFTAPSSGGSAIKTYDVQTATDTGFSQNLTTTNVTASPANLTSLIPGTKYYVRVRANNAVGNGAWSTSINFTTLSGTPTITVPAAGGSVTTATASVTVQALGMGTNNTITVQLSQDSTFATVTYTLTQSPSGPSSNNLYTLTDATKYLKTGTWYARAQVKNNTTAYTTPWSATTTFTEAHTPSVTLAGTTGTVGYTANTVFSWVFADAGGSGDSQKNYQLVVEDNLNGTSIYDSGKVASSAITASVALASTLKNQQLRWRVKVWDQGDTASPWSAYTTFTLADVPIVTVLAPANGVSVTTGAPTFTWSSSIPSGGNQAKAVITVKETVSNLQVWNTTVSGTGTTVTPSAIILRNTVNYTLTITVTDTNGLTGTSVTSFSAGYSTPNSIQYSVDGSGIEDLGYALVDWSQGLPDKDFAAWKVYRRDAVTPGAQWELLATYGSQLVRQYKDFMLTAGTTYIYSVTQTATRSGALLESTVGYYRDDTDTEVAENRPIDTDDLQSYWIINPDDTTLSVKLLQVIKDSSTLEFEQNSYTIIGRGRHTDYGDELGYNGSLTCQVRIPERPSSFRIAIENLRRAQETYWLRTPFGRLFQISLGSPSWEPKAGTGTSEMGDLTIPYLEVA